tara:strand:+ start:133 stop:885 length:753 start_codon:yes stop_codon:yes gene_type:complete
MALFPSPRIRYHEVLEREKGSTSTLSVYEDGARVVPSAATFSLKKPDGTVLKTGAATISGGGELSFVLGAVDLPVSLELDDDYQIVWEVTISGVVHTFLRPCAVARRKLYPVLTDLDLEAHYSDISSIRASSMTSYQSFITESFLILMQRLRDQGNWTQMIAPDPMSLRLVHLDLCFYLIFKDMDSSGLGEGRYLQLAQEHRRQYESNWKNLRFEYDEDQDGLVGDGDRRPAIGAYYTCRPPVIFRRRGW